MLVSVSGSRYLLRILSWVLVEFLFAGCGAEIVLLVVVKACVLGLALVHVHLADWIHCHQIIIADMSSSREYLRFSQKNLTSIHCTVENAYASVFAIVCLDLLNKRLGLAIAMPRTDKKRRRPAHTTHGGKAGSTVTFRVACAV